MGTLIAVTLALAVGAAIGFGFGRTHIDEQLYRSGWHDAIDQLGHPALPRRRRTDQRGSVNLDAVLIAAILFALIVGGSMIFGGPS